MQLLYKQLIIQLNKNNIWTKRIIISRSFFENDEYDSGFQIATLRHNFEEFLVKFAKQWAITFYYVGYDYNMIKYKKAKIILSFSIKKNHEKLIFFFLRIYLLNSYIRVIKLKLIKKRTCYIMQYVIKIYLYII